MKGVRTTWPEHPCLEYIQCLFCQRCRVNWHLEVSFQPILQMTTVQVLSAKLQKNLQFHFLLKLYLPQNYYMR